MVERRLRYVDAPGIPPEHRAREADTEAREDQAGAEWDRTWRAVVAAPTVEAAIEGLRALELDADRLLLLALALRGSLGADHPLVDVARTALPSGSSPLRELAANDDDPAAAAAPSSCAPAPVALDVDGDPAQRCAAALDADTFEAASAWLELAAAGLDTVDDPATFARLSERVRTTAAVLCFKWSQRP